jgi:cytochrome P450/ADP-ribose pyrophosphatase YjhB (NUDIX family)
MPDKSGSRSATASASIPYGMLQRGTWSSTRIEFKDEPTTLTWLDPALLPHVGRIYAVSVVPMTGDGRVVMAQLQRGVEIPGGKVEAEDADLEATARRETWEEACVMLGSLRLIQLIRFEQGEAEPRYVASYAGEVTNIAPFVKGNESLGRLLVSRRQYVAVFGFGSITDRRRLMIQASAALFRTDKTDTDRRPVPADQAADEAPKSMAITGDRRRAGSEDRMLGEIFFPDGCLFAPSDDAVPNRGPGHHRPGTGTLMDSPIVEPSKQSETVFHLPLPPELTDRGTCPFDPPKALAELSAQGKIQRVDMTDGDAAWLVTGHQEARTLLADPRLSSDRRRNPSLQRRITPELHAKLFNEKSRAGSFINMDPPEHTRYRKLLVGQFTPRRMRQLAPRIREIVTERIDTMIAKGSAADLVQDFALPVPSLVICELLGVRYDDRSEFERRTAQVMNVTIPAEDYLRIRAELQQFLRELVQEKRRNPTDDLLSGLVHSRSEPALTDDELAGMTKLILVAGHETTANMLALGAFALLENESQFRQLKDEPALIDGAIEELLRYLSVVQHMGFVRTTLADIEIDGQVIPKDSIVVVSVAEANRDSRQYQSPAVLDVTRPRQPHLAFGHGIHQCFGQQLARMEMAIGFTELLRRIPTLRLAVPAAAVPLRSNMVVYGVYELPVTWDSAE